MAEQQQLRSGVMVCGQRLQLSGPPALHICRLEPGHEATEHECGWCAYRWETDE